MRSPCPRGQCPHQRAGTPMRGGDNPRPGYLWAKRLFNRVTVR
ncbi:hypothetical protein [Amycolatopsis antarctica]|nr:hypothetical protein [Amycolatopsis antarctica]